MGVRTWSASWMMLAALKIEFSTKLGAVKSIESNIIISITGKRY
jgi:hypothetical protein